MEGDIKIGVVEKADLCTDSGKMRTVVFSHGMGGTRFLYSGICLELASHGYVVIAPEHKDKSGSMTYYYKSEEARINDERTWIKYLRCDIGKPAHHVQRSKQVQYRSKECSRCLEVLKFLNNGKVTKFFAAQGCFDFKQFKDRLDLSSPVMMGHSFGGATAFLTLAQDPQFRVGVILDPWVFPIKSFQDIEKKIDQPFIVINTQTFHIESNLKVLKVLTEPKDDHVRDVFTIRNTTHENQCDSVHVWGYFMNLCMKKIDPNLGTDINNHLILRFLNKHVGFKHAIYSYEFLQSHEKWLVKDLSIEGINIKPKKIPNIVW